MTAQEIVDAIEAEHIGSVIFRYSQGKDSSVGGSGLGGVCEGMCYNFVRVKLWQPYSSLEGARPLEEFRQKRDAGELAGGVFVKDESKSSPVTLNVQEKPGERQAAGGARFSQAVRNLDAKFKKPLSEHAKQTIDDSVLNRMYSDKKLIEYTEFPALLDLRSHMKTRDSIAEQVSQSQSSYSHLAPLLSRDRITEKLITFGEIPIKELCLQEKEKQTPERLGYLFGKQIKFFLAFPDRVLGICTVSTAQSGHAIALDVLTPAGPIDVLDPNFGLIRYQTWKEFKQGWGKMWQLYQFEYKLYNLRRYSARRG